MVAANSGRVSGTGKPTLTASSRPGSPGSPDWVQACRGNQQFVGRAVTRAAGQGIRQFLDLGAGLPTNAALAPGSALAISCGRNDDPAMWQRMRESYTAATTYNHTRDELRSFFGTWPLVPPGLALARSWRGGVAAVPDQPPGPAYVLAAVGVRP
jgi:hypothetical protein